MENTSVPLLLYTVIAVVGLIVLIARFKVNSIVAIVVASLFIGLCAGMEPAQLLKGFREGVGNVLGSIAMILGLGNMLGKMLEESGGAQRIGETLVAWFGPKRVHWAMMAIACIVGVPVFFQVGLVLLIPLIFRLSKETGTPLLHIGIPVLAGLSVMHGLVPPHPGPMAAIEVLKADVGRTILYSMLIGIPVTILAGPLLGLVLAKRVPLGDAQPSTARARTVTHSGAPPSFGTTVGTVLLPVVLMLLATVVDVALPHAVTLRRYVDFVGDPIVAMLIAVIVSFFTLGTARGFSRAQILKFSEECLAPIAGVLLIIGAGGGFSRVLFYSGVGDAVGAIGARSHVSPLILGWLIAALIRLSTGSATVAITTAAGVMAPMLAQMPGVSSELTVIAMGAGSLVFSHVNDAGFWLVKELLNMTVTQTLQTWSIMETVVSVTALALVLVLDVVLRF